MRCVCDIVSILVSRKHKVITVQSTSYRACFQLKVLENALLREWRFNSDQNLAIDIPENYVFHLNDFVLRVQPEASVSRRSVIVGNSQTINDNLVVA